MSLTSVGALVVASAVGLGAFGAHGLKSIVDEQALGWWGTAVDYQMWHGLALFGLGLAEAKPTKPRWRRRGVRLMVFGVLVFSGLLYTMTLTDFRPLGAVVPIGGLALIVSWVCLAWAYTPQSSGEQDR